MKLSAILQIIFWAALGLVLSVFYIWHALTYSIKPLLQAILHWLKFGVWEVQTFASANIIRETSWIGLDKILSIFGSIPTWWPLLIIYILLGYILYGFTFGQAIALYNELKEENEDTE